MYIIVLVKVTDLHYTVVKIQLHMCSTFCIYAGEPTTKEKAEILVMALGLVEQQVLTQQSINGWRGRSSPQSRSCYKLTYNSRK